MPLKEDKDFPAANYQRYVGKTVKLIGQSSISHEGLLIGFTDDTWLEVGFGNSEGSILSSEEWADSQVGIIGQKESGRVL